MRMWIVVGMTSVAVVSGLSGCAKSLEVARSDAAMMADHKVLTNVDASGLALQGYDPVAYFMLTPGAAPIKGEVPYTSKYRGGTYRFVSAENKAKFDSEPAKYEPQFGGWCAYAASINKLSPIAPEYWEIVDGQLVLQHNQKAWDLWHQNVASNLNNAQRNWPGLLRRHGRGANDRPEVAVNWTERGT